MKFEYLIFNALVAAGPIVFSFEQKIRFVSRWKSAVLAAASASVPFLIWDFAVTGDHWWFSSDYTFNLAGLNLPPGEILFFLTVPFACLFIWEILQSGQRKVQYDKSFVLYPILYAIGILGAIILFGSEKDYTGIVLIVVGLVALVDNLSDVRILTKPFTGRYLAILTGLILIFNGYLTARPVVMYNPEVISGIRIFTIPLEDFFYGYSLIVLGTIFYELYLGRRHE